MQNLRTKCSVFMKKFFMINPFLSNFNIPAKKSCYEIKQVVGAHKSRCFRFKNDNCIVFLVNASFFSKC